jgi:transposase-like protein
MKRDRRVFSPEFRQEAIELVRRSGKSANQVAKELGVNQTTLSRWQREATVAPPGTNGFQAAEELKQLRREVDRLRMERDILKKAAAFFAKESA